MPRQHRILAAALLLTTPVFAQTGKQKAALATALNASYSFTTGKTTGSVYAIRIPGLYMANNPITWEPEYTIQSTKPLRFRGPGFALVTGPHSTREVKVGEEFYLTAIDVDQNYLRFHLRSVALHDVVQEGNSYRDQFALALKFRLPHGAIATLTAAGVHALVDPILSTESSDSQRVHLGQSAEEVTGILGAPTREIALDNKRILVYSGAKVIFVDGKVTDIQ